MDGTKIRKLKDKAAHLVAKEKFKKALKIYMELWAAQPQDVSLMLKLGI